MYVYPLLQFQLLNWFILLETHLTDSELERIRKAQEDDMRKTMHTDARTQARERINTRRIERQVVSKLAIYNRIFL